MSDIKKEYPLLYKIVATLRAPAEASPANVRVVVLSRLSALKIESIELVKEEKQYE